MYMSYAEKELAQTHLEKDGYVVAALRTDDVSRPLKSGVLGTCKRELVAIQS